jgi:hypothetical protein
MKILPAIIFITLFSCNSAKIEIKEETTNDLAGAWRAVADQLIDSSGNVVRQDTNVSGLIIYTADGKMSAQILWKGVRSPLMNDSIMKQDGISTGLGIGSNTWSPEQERKLIDSYDSYFGDYTVDWKANIVTHTMAGNLRPEKEGTVYKRLFKIKNDSLFLRSTDTASRWQVAWVRNKK